MYMACVVFGNKYWAINLFKQWWSRSAVKEHALAVWQNADEDDSHFSAAACNNPGGGANQRKLKQRRMAKGLEREKDEAFC